jgi:hypothetical protein
MSVACNTLPSAPSPRSRNLSACALVSVASSSASISDNYLHCAKRFVASAPSLLCLLLELVFYCFKANDAGMQGDSQRDLLDRNTRSFGICLLIVTRKNIEIKALAAMNTKKAVLPIARTAMAA